MFKFENEFTVCGLLLNAFHEKQQEKHFFLSELFEAFGKLLWIRIDLAWKVDSFKVAIYFVNPCE